jgi:hypothetical protein
MGPRPTLDDLWDSPAPEEAAARENGAPLPEAARRYLAHAIDPGRSADAARLSMRGEIKLKRWLPFRAEEVLHARRGMIWKAAVRRGISTIRGYDRLVDGRGSMQWNLLGLIPVARASGFDITRSAAGRFAAELVWLPSALARARVRWTGDESHEAVAHVPVGPEQVTLHLRIDDAGALSSMWLSRWGNPGGGEHRYLPFGGMVEESGTFAGFTIPTRLRVGWHFGTDRFEPEGEFFRAEITEASYR